MEFAIRVEICDHFLIVSILWPLHFFSEAIEKEQARQRYEKLHAEGKTDEARADLARLAIIRKQREDAAKKKLQEKEGNVLMDRWIIWNETK